MSSTLRTLSIRFWCNHLLLGTSLLRVTSHRLDLYPQNRPFLKVVCHFLGRYPHLGMNPPKNTRTKELLHEVVPAQGEGHERIGMCDERPAGTALVSSGTVRDNSTREQLARSSIGGHPPLLILSSNCLNTVK